MSFASNSSKYIPRKTLNEPILRNLRIPPKIYGLRNKPLMHPYRLAVIGGQIAMEHFNPGLVTQSAFTGYGKGSISWGQITKLKFKAPKIYKELCESTSEGKFEQCVKKIYHRIYKVSYASKKSVPKNKRFQTGGDSEHYSLWATEQEIIEAEKFWTPKAH